jgi:hypothetical protein
MRALLILLLALPAAAQPADLTALGVREFNLGNSEFNLGHYEKALEHFETSYRLTGRAALLYNIGVVEKALYDRTHIIEHLERAIERWRNLISSTANDNDPKLAVLKLRVIEHGKAAVAELQRVRSERARGEAALELGEELLKQGKPDEASAQLDKFVSTPGNERPGLVRAWKLRASIAVARSDAAGEAEAVAAAASLDKLSVGHTPQGSLKPGAPVALTFAVESDPAHLVAGVIVHYRSGTGAFSVLPTTRVGRINLPLMFSSALRPGQKVEYFADVVDEHGAFLQHLGTADLPFAVVVETPRGPGVAKKWWFWTLTGVVVAGAAVGIGLGVHYSQPAPPLSVPIHTAIHSW